MIQRFIYEFHYLVKNAPWDTGISPPELTDFLAKKPEGRALDIGCGTGTNAITIALHGWDVVGIDLSSIAIARARRKAKRASVDINFHQGDATKIDGISGPFDLILDIGCFHGLPADSRKIHEANLRRLLVPGGTFLLYTWLKANEADRSWSPTEQQIRKLLENSFDFMQVEHGEDKHGKRSSAWFTFRRRP